MLLLAWGFLGFFTRLAQAVPEEAVEKVAKALEGELIAPCCWAKPVSEEYSQVAYEMRDQIRTMLRDGKTPNDVKNFFVAQYGERILSRPRAQGFNWLVWLVPPAALLLAFLIGWAYLKGSVKSSVVENPTPPRAANAEIEAALKATEDIA